MWKHLIDFGKQVFSLTRRMKDHEEDLQDKEQDIKEIRQKQDALSDLMKRVLFELEHDREMQRLQLENTLLRHQQSLPSSEGRVADLQRENETLRQRIAELEAQILTTEK